jgi:IMP dehydrogenase
MRWYKDQNVPSLAFDDVQLVQKKFGGGSRSLIDISTQIGDYTLRIPIIAANMPSICGQAMASKMAELGGLGIIHRFMSIQDQLDITQRWRRSKVTRTSPIAHSLGLYTQDKERYDVLVKEDAANILCIDTAHGYRTSMEDSIKYLRDIGFEGAIIAGNVCTREGSEALIQAGADLVKVGVGPGSVCTTRIKTGCGMPQLSAIDDTVGPRIADGGIKKPGDAVKALAVGASAIMIGGMLAGTDRVPGWHEDLSYITYAGSASSHTKIAYGMTDENAEGVVKQVETKPEGSTEKTIEYLVEGIRSGLSYNGAMNLQEHVSNAEFVRVTPAGVLEAQPHFSG